MANQKKFKDRYVASMPVEREIYKRLDRLLPRGVCISDEVNKFLKQKLEELEGQKNRDASITVESSPIKTDSYCNNIIHETIDKFIAFPEDQGKRVKDLWNKDSVALYDLDKQLEQIQTEITTVRFHRYKKTIPNRQLNLKLIPFIEQSVYGDL